MDSPFVQISDGQLRGVVREIHSGEKIWAFHGIPYARPPIGDLRFKAPQPAQPWEGVREACSDGSACYNRDFLLDNIVGSEDCLYLNVFTKDIQTDNLKPVMVFIHGGGYLAGSNDSKMYSPDFILTEDVVLVSINYRVGMLGFLSLPETNLEVPGNAGLKDQILALKWVQKNIGHFGGDRNNVTIFGESAGGGSVHYLVLSTMAKGLFHKAIAQSGCVLNPWNYGITGIKELLKSVGKDVKDDKAGLEYLKGLPVEELFKLQENILMAKGSVLRVFAPVVEKPNPTAFITETPYDIMNSGNYNKVPIMMGYCEKEGLMFEVDRLKPLIGMPQDCQINVEKMLMEGLELTKDNQMLKDLKQEVEKMYFAGDKVLGRVWFTTDLYFFAGILTSLEVHTATSSCPFYLYRFSVNTCINLMQNLGPLPCTGTSHGDDLTYLFKTQFCEGLQKGSTEEDLVLKIIKLWTNFAKFSNPTPCSKEFGVTWKPVEGDVINYLDIGNIFTAGINPDPERAKFWSEFNRKFFETGNRLVVQ